MHFPLYFQVMSTSGFTSTFSLFFGGALLLIVLNPVASSSTLCETRCENAVPSLKKLKTLWHNVSKRVGGDGKSFYFNLMDVFLLPMDRWMYGWMYVWVHVCMDGWMDRWMNGCGWMERWLEGWLERLLAGWIG